MQWIVAHNDHSVGFPQYLRIEDQIEYRKIKAAKLLEKIKQKYPDMTVIKANTLGSLIEIPTDINADDFMKEFDCTMR